MGKRLLRATMVTAAMTLLSRVLGLLRDLLIARWFGADAATDAFFAVFKVPNLLRRLFAEGAFAQAFVPMLANAREQGDNAALRTFIARAGGSLAMLLLCASVLGVVAAPLLLLALAPGFVAASGQFALATDLLKIVWPYLFFIGCTAFAAGVLNAHGRFAVPALTPALLNLGIIMAALWLAPLCPEPITALAWGVLLAGVAQLALQGLALARLGLLPRPRLGFRDPEVKLLLRRLLPTLFGVSVTQINLLLDTLLASFLAVGSVSWLYYSDRLVEFPLGLFGASLATVVLPTLAREHAAADHEGFSRSLDWGLRLTLLIALPAALGLVLLAQALTLTFYQYQAFSAADAMRAAQALAAYAVGLPGFMLIKVLASGFAARHDVRTPVRYGAYALGLHLLLGIGLMLPLGHVGLALATSLAAWGNAAGLLWQLLRTKLYRPGRHWLGLLPRLLVANAAMAALLAYMHDTGRWLHWGAAQRCWQLGLAVAAAIGVYGAALLIMRTNFRTLLDKHHSA